MPYLDKAWQYILDISNNKQQLKIARNIVYQKVQSASKNYYKYKNMARLLKQDWKSVSMAKEIMINLVYCLQLVVTI